MTAILTAIYTQTMVRAGAVDEDRADLEVLTSNLQKTDQLTSEMYKILSGFDARLEKMEHSMKPIHKTTMRLNLVQSNVDATLKAIQKTKDYWTIPGEEESTIKSGPENDVASYIGSIKRLDRGSNMLKSVGDESSQKVAHRISQLLQTGTSQLQQSYRSMLQEHSAQIEPLPFVLKNQALPAFDKKQVEFLRSVARFSKDDTHVEGMARSEIVKDFERARATYLQKSLYTFVLASQRNLEIRTQALYDRENNGIGHYTEALLRMSKQERSLCMAVFGEQDGPEVYAEVARPAYADYSGATKAILAHVKTRIGTDCYLGFETLEHMTRLSSVVRDIETPEIARDLHSVISNLAGACAGAFYELSEDTKKRSGALAQLPMDGGLVDVTKELASRLRRMMDYSSMVLDLIWSLGEGGWKRPPTGPLKLSSADPQAASTYLDQYAAEVIDNLLQTLEQKARSIHKKPSLVSVFMLNNATYIQRAVQRSELNRFVGNRPLIKIDEANKRAYKLYRESWDGPARQLMDITIMRPSDPKAARNSLTSKDRDAVKERFKSFNAEFDDLIRSCKGFSVVDSELRQSLTSEIRSIIVPLYGRFYDKYINSDFAKNKEKYIRYDKTSIEKVIWDALTK